MAFIHGKNGALLLDGVDVSQYFNDIDAPLTVDALDSTVFQSPGGAKTYVPGLQDGTLAVNGLFDTAGVIDGTVRADYAPPILPVGFSYYPDGGATDGSRVVLLAGLISKWEQKSAISTLVETSLEMKPDGGLVFGRGQNSVTTSTSGNSASYDHGSTYSTPNGMLLVVHVLANTRDAGSILFTPQQSTDGVTWVALTNTISVPAASVANGYYALPTVATVNRYTRLIWTVAGGTSGSYKFAFGIGRT